MSRGFICALFGVAMTVFAWFVPWEWPSWPALLILAMLRRTTLPAGLRPALVLALFALNVTFWAAAAYAASLSVRFIRKERL